MNGATAEIWLNTTRPPSSSITSMMGSSQYFLRTLRKAHSSIRTDIGAPRSEHVLQALRLRTGRRAMDPVARRLRIPLEAQQVLAREAQQQRGRGDDDEEQDAHDDGVHDPVQQAP